MDEVLHPFQIRQKLLASMSGGTSAVLLAGRQQVLAAEIKQCLLLKTERDESVSASMLRRFARECTAEVPKETVPRGGCSVVEELGTSTVL